MSLTTREVAPSGDLTVELLEHVVSSARLPEAPAIRLDDRDAPPDVEWAALAAQHVTTVVQRSIVDVFARHDGEILSIEEIAEYTGANRKTVRRVWRSLRAAELLGRERKTLAGRGFVGHRYLLRPRHLRMGHRDEQAVSADGPPAPDQWATGMPVGFAADGPPAPCCSSVLEEPKDVVDESSLENKEQHTYDERTSAREISHDRVSTIVAGLERKYRKPVRRGKHRELLFANLRDHEDGVRACFEQADKKGSDPLAFALRMIEDGDHLVLFSSAVPRCLHCEKRSPDVHDRYGARRYVGEDCERTTERGFVLCDGCADYQGIEISKQHTTHA